MKKIAIIILEKSHIDLTFALLDSIYSNDDYDLDYMKIYLADTGSSNVEKQLIRNYINKSELEIKFIEYSYYNFAKINNDVVKKHIDKDTDLILLCNNDIQLINNAISKVVKVYEEHENVGTVGGLLLYPNLTIQHAGVITVYQNIKNNIRCNFTHLKLKKDYENLRDKGTFSVWGNTGAFLLTSYFDWKRIKGLNENYENCFEDVEYNLTLLKEGKKNLICQDALCFHKESSTRHQATSENDVIRIRQFADDENLRKISVDIANDLIKNKF